MEPTSQKENGKRARSASAAAPERKRIPKSEKAFSSAPSTSTPTTTTTSTPRGRAAPCKHAMLVVSTYHAVMAGLVYKHEKFFIKFSVKRHVGRVNGTAVTARYIASSGADERVFLFTNKAEERQSATVRQKRLDAGEPLAVRLADLGSLTPPTEVTAMAFADASQHLLCGCADGQLLLYRCRDWSLVTTLTVHEKAIVAVAVHPGSQGRLAVTISADRAVAVLDLVKGKLLTKWKYTPVVIVPEESSEKAQPNPPSPKSIFAPTREEPTGLHFSPCGQRMLIFSRFSFVIYDAASMQPLCGFRSANPQPPQEIHCAAFANESIVLFGTEAGVLRYFSLKATTEHPQQVQEELRAVEVHYPTAVAAQAAALLAAPVRADLETRQKNPLRHVNRIKALQVRDSTAFSIDSSGIVVAWNMEWERQEASELTVRYVTSANCQGRVTDMELYPL